MTANEMGGDRASEAFWSARWNRDGPMRQAVDPNPRGRSNPVHLAYHRYFQAVFAGLPTADLSLIEIGCARSRWLPYFRQQYGFKIAGLDYSEIGCEQATSILENAGIKGDIICADLFDPPAVAIGQYDILVSFGVVEHFDDTASCLRACARLLKPSGLMLTFIPNMRGAVGWLQRRLSAEVYDVHVPLRAHDLAQAHEAAGLSVSTCDHLMFANWGVVNHGRGRGRTGSMIRHALSGASKASWAIERLGGPFRPNPVTSPYIACAARKGEGSSNDVGRHADAMPLP